MKKLMVVLLLVVSLFGGKDWETIIMSYVPGNTPLHKAIRKGDITKAEQLIKYGADVNAKGAFGITPLEIAVSKGSIVMVNVLLSSYRIDVNVKDNEGTPFLHKAIKHHQIDIAKRLVRKGADVNVKDHFGYTPLHEASMRGQYEVVKLLIAYGASVNVKNRFNRTSLYWASRGGHKEIVELLKKHGGKQW